LTAVAERLAVYRERIGADEEEPRWYLHGLFG
jgi:hypothetical protein